MNQDPKMLLQTAEADVFKTFLVWILDQHKKVRVVDTLNIYWRILLIHILDQTGRRVDENVVRDVSNVSNSLRTCAESIDWSLMSLVSIEGIWLINVAFADYPKSAVTAVPTIYTTFFSIIGCVTQPSLLMSNNAITCLRVSLWLLILDVGRFQCSIRTPHSRNTTQPILAIWSITSQSPVDQRSRLNRKLSQTVKSKHGRGKHHCSNGIFTLTKRRNRASTVRVKARLIVRWMKTIVRSRKARLVAFAGEMSSLSWYRMPSPESPTFFWPKSHSSIPRKRIDVPRGWFIPLHMFEHDH